MKKKILIVEDEELILHDIAIALDISGYQPLTAENGKQALEIAKKEFPDMILSDIMMPEMDGYELLSEVRRIPEIEHIPFLFLTARGERSDVRLGMNLGADDYLIKPFDFDELLKAITTRLKRKESTEQYYMNKVEDLRKNLRNNIPHEIRTPMTSILGFSEYLFQFIDSKIPGALKEAINNIYHASKRLNRLFENYVIYANLEITALNPEDKNKFVKALTFFPKAFIYDAAIYHGKIYNRQNDVKTDIEDTSLLISENFFYKMIDELIENCFKFSKYGTSINISAKNINNMFIMKFRDEGRGMTAEQISRIGPFVQFDRGTMDQQGLGLGIHIAKRIAELHDGTFSIESEPEQFTEITVTLPSGINI